MEEKQTSSETNEHNRSTRKNNNNPKSSANNSRVDFDRKTHALKKRASAKPYHRKNDIYVSNKSNFKSQLKQCQELLANIDESGEVYLHCLGNAIKRGINLALTLVQQSDGGFGYEANTSTINLIDDLHPLNDEEDFSIQRRKNSCLHIKVFRHSNVLKTRKN